MHARRRGQPHWRPPQPAARRHCRAHGVCRHSVSCRCRWLAAALALALLAAVALSRGPGPLIDAPAAFIVAVSVTVSLTAATQALNGAEGHARATAVLDPLTGLLNRHGLERRFGELAQQAKLIGAPISMLVCDLDHFKAVNDRHGHTTGDVVLRDVAYTLRKALRSFKLIYRIGGEEFLILLPGATSRDAADLAERLCEVVRETRSGAVPVDRREHPDRLRDRVLLPLSSADAALYRAKAEGRDCVRTATSKAPPVRAASSLEPEIASAPA